MTARDKGTLVVDGKKPVSFLEDLSLWIININSLVHAVGDYKEQAQHLKCC